MIKANILIIRKCASSFGLETFLSFLALPELLRALG